MAEEYILSNQMKVWRAKKELTQQQLADLVGVTRATINFIERGKRIPSTLLALKIAHVFDTALEEVFFLKEKQPWPLRSL